jgi:hypothetical protein
MSLKDEFRKMVNELAAKFTPPPIANIFFPPFYKGGQPGDAQFMAISLEGGATGISFVLLKIFHITGFSRAPAVWLPVQKWVMFYF